MRTLVARVAGTVYPGHTHSCSVRKAIGTTKSFVRKFLAWAAKLEEKMKNDRVRTRPFLEAFREKSNEEMDNLREQKKELMNQL